KEGLMVKYASHILVLMQLWKVSCTRMKSRILFVEVRVLETLGSVLIVGVWSSGEGDLEDDEFELLFGEGLSQPIVEESPEESLVEEVVPVKRKGSTKRSYDVVNCKWKNRIRPKVSQFCETYNSVKSDEKVEETQPVDRDKTKRMGSTSAARSASSSAAADTGLVDTLLRKFTQCATLLFSSRKEASFEYLRIKERELEMQD
ncbi:hypothetical protein Tco_1199203, partial [Tanacetum coccineum]